jgi:hypothetical protein
MEKLSPMAARAPGDENGRPAGDLPSPVGMTPVMSPQQRVVSSGSMK